MPPYIFSLYSLSFSVLSVSSVVKAFLPRIWNRPHSHPSEHIRLKLICDVPARRAIYPMQAGDEMPGHSRRPMANTGHSEIRHHHSS
jgi:hypothetical protein